MTAPTTYEIGASLGTIATLASQDIINPESTFIDFPSTVKLASGLTRGLGFPQAQWHFGYMTSVQYDALRTLCTGISATVCIATMNNDRDFVRYNCSMEVPPQYVIRADRYIDVTVLFTGLVAAE